MDDCPNARMAALREQLGEVVWAERLAAAADKEAVVLGAALLREQGASAAEAAEAFSIAPPTLANWSRRYAADGVAGLVDGKGRLKRIVDAGVLERTTPRRNGRTPGSFLKWAGSKGGVMRHLLPLLPSEYGTYFEPFVGSGTVFLALRPTRAVLGDTNAELMNTWQVVRDRVDELVDALRAHVNSYEHFVSVRAQDPEALSPVDRAARLVFLNKTCFNGLYRVNRSGRFNVPYGRIPHANIVDERTLLAVSARLQGVALHTGTYEATLQPAKAGDLVYLDPPYLAAPGTPAMSYGAVRFDEAAHVRLAEVFRELDQRGCHVVLSNSDLPRVRELYQGYAIEVLATRRQIHPSAEGRAGHFELVVTNRAPAAPALDQLTLFRER